MGKLSVRRRGDSGVILNRKTMLTRTKAVTEVLMPDTGADVTEPRGEKSPV
jgi:hypothetical protein